MAVMLAALGVCALIVALVLMGTAMFVGLRGPLGDAWAAALTALLPLITAGGFLWVALIIRK